ncbi:hypothetical protein MKD41_10470 [Lutibacter sp. A64]|uniref:hypothetical protein n=1 Tax=Lutibacter sp. A64 TaxID=2918526 RepID=UPI001F05A2B7|nr:hypothetical protein [Lutibacter sp. A64]UMB52759.1 hypothetical protein MKD41_10470 [Lutibacter sp. A64]
MAKLTSIKLGKLPDSINVGNALTEVSIEVTIDFHKIDLQLEMEYMLFLFVYDINGKIDIPIIIENWDKTEVYGISDDRHDHLMGTIKLPIKATKSKLVLNTSLELNLGKISKGDSYFSKHIEVFGTLIPAIGRASNWSKPKEVGIVF